MYLMRNKEINVGDIFPNKNQLISLGDRVNEAFGEVFTNDGLVFVMNNRLWLP